MNLFVLSQTMQVDIIGTLDSHGHINLTYLKRKPGRYPKVPYIPWLRAHQVWVLGEPGLIFASYVEYFVLGGSLLP